MVLVGMTAKDAFYVCYPFIAESGKYGGPAFKKVDTIIDGYHIPAAFSHQGEGACIAYNFK